MKIPSFSNNNWKINTKRVAVFIVNYNMPEMADNLFNYLKKEETYPIDIYLIDNGSDMVNASKNTNVFIKENIQTTNGWLYGLKQSDKKIYNYFAYTFLITSTQFIKESYKPITSMVKKLIDDPNAVGVHASLSRDSTTNWKHLINRGTNTYRKTWFIDNICSMYRADWFNSIGRFDKNLIYAWGIDLETSYIARKQGRSLWVDENIQVRKTTNIGYKMKRMGMTGSDRVMLASKNMNKILTKKYGKNYMDLMLKEYVGKDMI